MDTFAFMSSYRIACLVEKCGQSATNYQEKKGSKDQFDCLW